MLIEIKNDGPLGAIVLQGGSFPTEGIPFFIWMVISLRSRLLDVVADAAIISEVRGKSETSEQNPFFATKRQVADVQKRGLAGRLF